MGKYILMLALLVLPTACFGEIFKWIDEKGVVNFADDLGKIPKKYRDKALLADQAPQAVEVIDKGEGESPSPKARSNKDDKLKGEDEKGKAKSKTLYDGKEGATWKRDFERQKAEVKSLEEQAARIRDRIANPGKISRTEFVTLQNTSRDMDSRITAAKQKLDTMNDAANRSDLPSEFR